MDTTENNKIIAEFMGAKATTDTYFILNMYMTLKEEELKYNTDWNWLMEVVEKIESFNSNLQSFSINGNRVEIKDFSVKQNLFSYYNDTEKTKIQAVYNACVEFIKWYNLNNK